MGENKKETENGAVSKNGNKTGNKAVKVIVVLLLVITGFFCLMHFGMELGSWKGSSFDEYKNRAYTGGSYSLSALPDGASDFRFQCHNYGLGAYSFAAFTLNEKEFEDYISSVKSMQKDADTEGFDFAGKKVAETMDYHDDYGSYSGFPQSNCSYVTDVSIKDYTIMYYDCYHGAGTSVNAVVADPDTGRVIVVNGGTN